MGILTALHARLLLVPAVTDVIGMQLYLDERAQIDPLPGVVLHLISDPRPVHFGGPMRFRRARIQIDCLGRSRAEADAIGEIIIDAVTTSPIVREPADGIRIESSFVVNVRGGSEQSIDATTHRTAIDLMVWHHILQGD